MRFLFVLGCIASIGCSSTKVDVPATPVEPDWIQYTRQPIVEKVDNNYVVSDEFVYRSAQERRYIEKIQRWKQINRVP